MMHLAPLQPGDLGALAPLFERSFGRSCPLITAPLAEGFLAWRWAQREAASATSQGWVLWAADAPAGFISTHLDVEGNATVSTPVLAELSDAALWPLLDAARGWLSERGKRRAEFIGLHRGWQTAFGGNLFMQLLNQGCWCYPEGPLEVVMALDVARYQPSPTVTALRARLESEGLGIEWLTPPWVAATSALMWASFQRRGLAQPLAAGSECLPYVICRQGDEVLAFCGPVQLEPFGFGDWSFPFVVEAQRGRGIGAAVIAEATAWLQQAGAQRQVIATDTANERAQRLYRQAGFHYCYVAAHELFLGVGG